MHCNTTVLLLHVKKCQELQSYPGDTTDWNCLYIIFLHEENTFQLSCKRSPALLTAKNCLTGKLKMRFTEVGAVRFGTMKIRTDPIEQCFF